MPSKKKAQSRESDGGDIEESISVDDSTKPFAGNDMHSSQSVASRFRHLLEPIR